MTLDQLPLGQTGRITDVAWATMAPAAGQRLRELGLDCGSEVVALHRGSLFFRDPLAVQVGSTRIILRSRHAAAFAIEPVA